MSSVDLSLEGKVALVTGGSKGIGRAIALTFAEHGADVAIAARGVEALDATREALLATGRRAIAVQCDVGNDDDLARTVRETEEQLGGVGILVNNAATGSQASLRRTTADDLLQVMRVNVWAPLRLSQLCHTGMVERGGGVIINVVSNEGVRPSVGIGVYAPSKAALINLSQLCAKHWAKDGIRVTSIAPGLTHGIGGGPCRGRRIERAVPQPPAPYRRARRDRRSGAPPRQPGRHLRHGRQLHLRRWRGDQRRRRSAARLMRSSSSRTVHRGGPGLR